MKLYCSPGACSLSPHIVALEAGFSPLFNKAASADWQAAARENLSRRFDWVSAQLAGKNYLMGEQFTVADAYLFTVLNWCQWTGMDLVKWPVLKDYVARVAARPAVQAALKAEGLLN